MSEYDHEPELYVAMIAGRDKRIRELEAENKRLREAVAASNPDERWVDDRMFKPEELRGALEGE